MTTSMSTFRRLMELSPEDQQKIECRYDGTIPEDFVISTQPKCFSLSALREEKRSADIAARQYWEMAKVQLRNAARSKVFSASTSRGYVRRCRLEAYGYLERRSDMKRLSAACAAKLSKMES